MIPANAFLPVVRTFLVVLLWCLSPPPLSAQDETGTTIARLAARSLLLDAERAGDRVVAVGERGHVLVSDDDGRTWRQVSTPTTATLTAVAFRDESTGWAVGHDAVILHTRDGGETWVLEYADPDAEQPLLDVAVVGRDRVIAVGAYGLFLESPDDGASWSQRSVVDEDPHLNGLASTSDGDLILAGEFGTLYRNRDADSGWEPLTSPYDGSFFGALAVADGTVLLYGLQGTLFRGDGATWRLVETGTTALLMGGTVLNDGRILIVGSGGTLLVSENGGIDFRLIRRADRTALADAVQTADGAVILVGEAGSIRIEDPSHADDGQRSR